MTATSVWTFKCNHCGWKQRTPEIGIGGIHAAVLYIINQGWTHTEQGYDACPTCSARRRRAARTGSTS